MTVFQKWLVIFAVAGLAAAVEAGDRGEPTCSALKLGCPSTTFSLAGKASAETIKVSGFDKF